MAELATAWVQIVPSARGMQGALERELTPQATAAAKEAGDKSGKGFAAAFESQTGRSLKDFGKSALIGAAALGVGLYGVTNAAGGLEAALAANEQVLGDVSDAVQEVARDSVRNFGLSERAVLQASTAFGQLGKVAGLAGDDLSGFSIEMVGLAADLAAFADVPADQAVQDLRAAFAGSVETMQKYNVFLNETELKSALYRATGEEVTGVLTAQQRVLATHAALMEQTGDIQGQAAREAGGFQRAQDNLRATLEDTAASIGQSTLPAVTALLRGVTSGIGAVGQLNEQTNGLIGGLLLVGTAGLGAAGSVALVADKASKAIKVWQGLGQALQVTTIATAGVAAAAVAGFVIWDRFRRRQQEIRQRTDDVAKALNAQYWETVNLAEASGDAAGEIDGLATANEALSRALTETGDDGEKTIDALGALGKSADDAASVLIALKDDPVDALRQLALEAGATGEEADRLARKVNDSADPFWGVSDANLWLTDRLVATGQAMEELQDQAGKIDMDRLADSFLNAEAAGKGLTDRGQELNASLVEQARAAATSADGSYDAVAAWRAYGDLIADLTPEQRDLINSTDDLADAAGAAAAAGDDMNNVTASSIKVMSRAESALERAANQATAFGDALDRLIGVNIDLQGAADDLQSGWDELTETVTAARAGTDGYSLSLDAASEEGRKNREMVRQQAEGILTYSQRMLDAGSSIDEASDAAAWNTATLRNQLVQFGLTEAEADAYIATLGLTPENIATAVELYGDEGAKQRVEAWLDDLDEIPESEATEIQALIDEGRYQDAERRIAALTVARNLTLNVVPKLQGVLTGAKNAVANTLSMVWGADGGVFDRPTVMGVGEAGREVLLPLTRPDRMQELLADPRVYSPVLSALPRIEAPTSGTPRAVTGMHVDTMVVQDGTDAQTVARLINHAIGAA